MPPPSRRWNWKRSTRPASDRRLSRRWVVVARARVEAAMELAGEHVSHRGDQREHLQVERVGLERAARRCAPGPAHAVRAVELDQLADSSRRESPGAAPLAASRTVGGDGAATRRPGAGSPSAAAAARRRPRLRPPRRPIPVRLAQVGEVAPAALVLARGVQRDALVVDAQRDRLGDERRLAPVGGGPARDRVVLGQVQPDVGLPEAREALDARPHRVGELRHRQRGGAARVARGRRREVDAVGEQRVELVAHLAIDPLRVGLPAGDRLEARRALQRHRLGEAAVEHQRRLVDLQRDGDAALGLNEVLLARERRVEHADEQLHQHGGVAGAHRAERALDDEHLLAGDHAVEVDPQRVVEQNALDRRRVQQPRELVHRARRAWRWSCCGRPPAARVSSAVKNSEISLNSGSVRTRAPTLLR